MECIILKAGKGLSYGGQCDTMEFMIKDNSAQFYRGALPEERGGKFVQLTKGSLQVVAFSPMKLHPYHANIAEAFLRSQGVFKGSYNAKRDHFYPDSTGWRILGGGIWSLSEKKGELLMGGASQAYGPFVPEGLAKAVGSSEAFKGYKVVVEG